MTLLTFYCGFATASSFSNIPAIMSAPVVLYDEANNVLADADYVVTIILSDILETTLYAEEQLVTVNNGVAHITIGQGYALDSSFSSPAGGLSWDVFAHQGDITVEMLVEGQVSPQEITVLGSQPYSFISQQALSIADDAVTSSKIKNGTITQADLDEGLLALIESGSSGSSSSDVSSGITLVDAKNVSISSSMGLNNASGDTVYDVLQGLDSALDVLRDTHLSQNITNLQNTIDSISSNVSNLDATYVTDSAFNSSVSSMNASISANSSNIAEIEETVSSIDTSVDIDDVPVAIRPVAYGYMESSNECENMTLVSGYNISSINPSHSGVTIYFENAVSPRGTLIMVTDDVSNPGTQSERDHRCIRGKGKYTMSSSSVTSLSLIQCSDSSDCNSIPERAVSFMVYLVPQ
jgi:hypothetical protein